MKILILNSILFTADNNVIPKVNSIKDTMIYNMCLGFKQLGHTPILVAAEEYQPIKDEKFDFEIKFFKSVFTSVFKPSVLPLSKNLWQYLKSNERYFDFILSSETFSFTSLMAARICPRKTIIWQELTAYQRKMHQVPSKVWHNFVAKFFMRRVKAVVPRSYAAHDFIKNYMPCVSDLIVDHGINPEKFIQEKNKKRQVISSSQLIQRKNVDGIIRVFNEFHKLSKYNDVKLLIAGRGEEEQNLKTLVNELGLNESVVFIGFLQQQKLNEFIRQSLCFLVNTRRDLNMVSIPESIMSGTPILTNAQPASATYIKQNELGVVCDNWGVNELAQIIDNNSKYVDNCFAYHNNLTNSHAAQQLIDNFLNK